MDCHRPLYRLNKPTRNPRPLPWHDTSLPRPTIRLPMPQRPTHLFQGFRTLPNNPLTRPCYSLLPHRAMRHLYRLPRPSYVVGHARLGVRLVWRERGFQRYLIGRGR